MIIGNTGQRKFCVTSRSVSRHHYVLYVQFMKRGVSALCKRIPLPEALSEYEAGLAAARIMTAAEELWMDLTFAETNEAQCLISVCRRTDSVKLNRRVPEKAGVGAKAVPLYS